MQSDGKKACRTARPTAAGLALLALLGACERTPQPDSSPPEPDSSAATSCGDDGRLAAQLYGSITREISWSSGELECESMLRPDGKGIRLRMVGRAADSRLAIILAMPELERGSTTVESPTVVTLTVEGSGRFFSTPTLDSCWSDIAAQEPVDDSSDRYTISGILFCVAPLGEINGDAAISIPELEFSGIIEWSAT
ncbi:MAG: hypothetical protein OEM92_03340 [Gammaproteobacteria bacterium]|nr:hypothetical protein [Gammaproteobacteria bacterium]MDH3364300.1 hypothetical protein [Gammaproteobacteria bacterium]